MRSQLLITAVVSFVGSALGAPILATRDISLSIFTTLELMEQFAAASYCPANFNSTGNKLECDTGTLKDSCPEVEASTTRTIVEFENTFLTDTTGYVAVDDTHKLVVVAFRGSESVANWAANLDIAPTNTDLCDGCQAHSGFWNSWLSARAVVLKAIKTAAASHPGYELRITGHSLGAAVATLAAAELRKSGTPCGLYTFGCPRVADPTLATFISNQAGGNYRVTHYNDLVPRLPPQDFGYAHVSPEYWIDQPNNVTVTPADIQVFQGIDVTGGNEQFKFPSAESHLWYFNAISACAH